MKEERKNQAYDIIGDIHGHSDALEALLQKLGYVHERNAYRHPEGRKAIFVGDFIDRGPQIRRSLKLVMAMWYHGSALAVLGNHEVNALAYHSMGINGQPLRAHTVRAMQQHAATIDQFKEHPLEWQQALDWFALLPVFLDLDGLIVVHAAWDERMPYFFPGGRINREMLADMQGARRTPAAKLLKRAVAGQEAPLPEGMQYTDVKGMKHPDIRVAWWMNLNGATYVEALFPTGCVAPDLPLKSPHPIECSPHFKQKKPVFFGHYWLNPKVYELAPLAANVCCVDYSVAREGLLVAYRWDGESALSGDKFVTVEANAKPPEPASSRLEPYSNASEIMARRPKEFPCSFIDACTISEMAEGMEFWSHQF